MSNDNELYYAEMEATRNELEDAYFKARPQLDRSIQNECLFRAGFERAWSVLWHKSAWIADMRIFEWCQSKLGLRPPSPRELRSVDYYTGDKMLRANEGWRLAPEEDRNNVPGRVYLERDAHQTFSKQVPK